MFRVANLSVNKGEKVQGYLDLPFSEDKIPCTLVYGTKEGPTALITGGIHNAEYVGIEAVTGIAREIQPEDITGKLIVVNIVNINGFKARTISVAKEDGKNLNRVFPGNPDGTYSDKLAHFMEKELFSKTDYYIDVHNGDWFEDLTPYIYAVGACDPEVAEKAKAMAMAADVPFYIKSNAKTGAYNYAGILGIPSVLLERGGLGLWTAEETKDSKKDIRNILREIGILTSKRFRGDLQRQIPRRLPHVHYLDSDKAGCWFPLKKPGEAVGAGEVVGVLKDFLGNVIDEIVLKEDCIILYQTAAYSVPENTPLIAYGHYYKCEEAEEEKHDHNIDTTATKINVKFMDDEISGGHLGK